MRPSDRAKAISISASMAGARRKMRGKEELHAIRWIVAGVEIYVEEAAEYREEVRVGTVQAKLYKVGKEVA